MCANYGQGIRILFSLFGLLGILESNEPWNNHQRRRALFDNHLYQTTTLTTNKHQIIVVNPQLWTCVLVFFNSKKKN